MSLLSISSYITWNKIDETPVHDEAGKSEETEPAGIAVEGNANQVLPLEGSPKQQFVSKDGGQISHR